MKPGNLNRLAGPRFRPVPGGRQTERTTAGDRRRSLAVERSTEDDRAYQASKDGGTNHEVVPRYSGTSRTEAEARG